MAAALSKRILKQGETAAADDMDIIFLKERCSKYLTGLLKLAGVDDCFEADGGYDFGDVRKVSGREIRYFVGWVWTRKGCRWVRA